jgi:hypothetical protein
MEDATYRVRWSKTYYASGFVEIDAESAALAEAIALENIGDYEGSMQYDPDGDLVEHYGEVTQQNKPSPRREERRPMDSTYIESTTAHKVGWGRAWWRRVSGLTPEERQAVRAGSVVWFAFTPWHYTQSGYKVVTSYGNAFDSREPTSAELESIAKAKEGVTHGLSQLH